MAEEKDTSETKTEKHNIITSKALFDVLDAHELIPDPMKTYRVTIDCTVGEICKVTFYTYADDRYVEAFKEIVDA